MHTEKLKIFDEYAIEAGFGNWWCLCFDYCTGLLSDDEFNLLVFEACDLVQKEQQKRILDKARIIVKKENKESEAVGFGVNDLNIYINDDSILSEDNLIK